jgi:hypothetical protein
MTLCISCQNFDIQSFFAGQEAPVRKGYRLQTVLNGSGGGCEFCSLLLLACKKKETDAEFEYYQKKQATSRKTCWVALQLRRRYKDAPVKDGWNIESMDIQLHWGYRVPKVSLDRARLMEQMEDLFDARLAPDLFITAEKGICP